MGGWEECFFVVVFVCFLGGGEGVTHVLGANAAFFSAFKLLLLNFFFLKSFC